MQLFPEKVELSHNTSTTFVCPLYKKTNGLTMCEVWIRVVDTKPYRSSVMLGLGCVTAMLFKASAPEG